MASPPYTGQIPDDCPNSDAIISHTLRTIQYMEKMHSDSGADETWCQKLLLFSLKLILNCASAISPEQLTQVRK